MVLTGSVIIGTREEKQQSKDGTQDGHDQGPVTDSVGLRDGDTVAKALGAGGIEADILAGGGRFRDDPRDDSDSDGTDRGNR